MNVLPYTRIILDDIRFVLLFKVAMNMMTTLMTMMTMLMMVMKFIVK